MTDNRTTSLLRELAQRRSADVVVTLLWDPAEDRVVLAVDDLVGGSTTEVEPHPGLERFAYEHPFAYLASVDDAAPAPQRCGRRLRRSAR